MRLLSVCFLLLIFSASAKADADAEALCAQYGLTNVDCSCVSKRYDAYMMAAKEPRYQRVVAASYRYALDGDEEYLDILTAQQQDMQGTLRYQNRFESISGGDPGNIDDFFEGCAIEGAPMTPLPPLSAIPIHQKLYKACMDFYPDERSCQCQIAQTTDATTQTEAKAYYYSFNEKGNGSFEENNRLSAQKAGLSLEAFRAADTRARSKIGENYKGKVNCIALRWADGRAGRTAEQRAGVPLGFENYEEIAYVDPVAQAQAARADGEAMRAEAAAEIAAFKSGKLPAAEDAPAEKASRTVSTSAQGTPLEELLNGCESDGNDPSTCACLGGVFEKAAAGANDTVARQLAFMMSGGGGEAAAMQLMQQASPQDLAAAGQLFQQNIMSIMTCQ
ncbi:MAG: hypothetical protein AAF221_15285 [Pseudomonadota bacterium]